MKLLILTLKNMLSKPLICILVSAQLFIALTAVNISIGQYQYFTYHQHMVDKWDIGDHYYLTLTTDEYMIQDLKKQAEVSDKIDKSIADIPFVDHQSYILDFHPILIDAKSMELNTRFLAYDDFLTKKIDIPLREGDWFSEDSIDIGQYPAILGGDISKQYRIGDIIKFKILDSSQKEHLREFLVIGKLKEPQHVLSFNIGGSDPVLSDIFKRYESVVLTTGSKDKIGSELNGFKSMGRMVFVSPETTKTDAKLIETELGKYGFASTIRQMKANQQEVIDEKAGNQWIMNILLLILAIAGMVGSGVLNTFTQMNEYSVYYLCGLKWERCIMIILLRMSILSIIPSLLAYLLLTTGLIAKPVLSRCILNWNNLVFSFLFLAIIILLSAVLPIFKFRTISPVSLLRRYE